MEHQKTKKVSADFPKSYGEKEVSPLVGKSVPWLQRARWAGNGPPFIKIGRNVRYLHDDLLLWFVDRPKLTSTSQLKRSRD